MSLTETSTVGLNLSGDFASQALADYNAAVKLAEGMDALAQASARVKSPAIWTGADNIKFMEASARVAVGALNDLAAAEARAAAAAPKWTAADNIKYMEASARTSAEAMGQLREQSAKAAEAMNKLRAASAFKVKAPELGDTGNSIKALEKQIASFELAPQLERKRALLEKQLGGMRAAMAKSLEPPKVAGADGAWAGGASSEMEQLAGKSAMMGAMAGGAATIAIAGLTKIAELAKDAAVKVYDLSRAFLEIGIHETSKAEMQREVFAKLGGNYDVAIKIAGQYGIDGDAAAAQVKKLLAAKFSETEIEAIVKVDVGMSAVLGDEKARAFIEKMTQQKNKGGKASEDTIKGFAEAGVSVDQVWKQLAAKLGVSVAQAQGKVKAGTVDMKDALDSVRKAAEMDFGGIADKVGNTIPVLLARVKLGISQLFSGFDLTPMKEALKNVAGLLEGPEGKLLKEEFSLTGSAMIKALFGPFEGAEGKQRLIGIMAELVALLRVVREVAKAAGEALKTMLPSGAAPGQGLAEILKGQRKTSDFAGGPMTWSDTTQSPAEKMMEKLGQSSVDVGGTVKTDGSAIGGMFNEGVAEGIENNPDAAAAAFGLGQDLLAKLRGSLGIASPSKEAMAIMGHFGDGMVKGAENDNGAAEAGAHVAAQVSGSTSAGLAGGAGGGAPGAGGGSVVINVIVPPGSPAETQAAAKAGAEAGLREWQAYKRADARERAA